MKYAVAVLDIGMTNKKVQIFDDSLRAIDSVSRTFAPVMVKGLETHDLAGIESWFYENLRIFAAKYPVRVIAVTTHGASFVAVDEKGDPSVPSVYYTHEPGEEFHERFYSLLGKPEELQATTGTPRLEAMINTSKGILFSRETFPEDFARTKKILMYPQYYGFRLTGNAGLEPTYIGCHTYLWDFGKGAYSDVADKLGISPMLAPKLEKSWSVLGKVKGDIAARLGLDPDTIVTMGIHDSNASLLPYLAKQGKRDFVLNSTGTWCVIMHPADKFEFSPDELGKVVFFNQSAMRTPVKTTIFLGGLEFDAYTSILRELNNRSDLPSFDSGLYAEVLAQKDCFILPELVPGSGQFPGSKARAVENGKEYFFDGIKSGSRVPAFFRDWKKALAVLNISLVIQTIVALKRAGLRDGTDVYIEGGFRRNVDYTTLLASWYPGSRICLTDIKEATSFGAAMTAKMAMEGVTLDSLASDFEIDYTVIGKTSFPDFKAYADRYLELA